MALTTGTRLGPYEVVAALGAGGMGEVYRARDARLNRDVALKVLPAAFTTDSDRLSRFKREAQVLAALNHPNIAAIYGLEESSGTQALVLELVEGPTLADLIATGPRLSVEEILIIARQIVEALEAAHEKGVVHRDLKPANIKLTPDRAVKVLDFGLAKALDHISVTANVTQSPTLSLGATQPGLILGTAAYMSPEQARGLAADHRSDVFSFGVVLYEMLTGHLPFAGETVADILASVLARDPDLTTLPANLNPRLADLIRRCLDKNPKSRWQAIGDVRVELDTIAASPKHQSHAQPHARAQWKVAAALVVTTAVTSVLTAYATWKLKPTLPASVVRLTVASAKNPPTRSFGRRLAISPDGRQIVFVADRQLFLRDISQSDAVAIRGTESSAAQRIDSPTFSPDGQSLAFFSGGTIKKVAVGGGTSTTLYAGNVLGMSWDDTGLVFSDGVAVRRIAPGSGQPELLFSAMQGVVTDAQLLPDGRTLLLVLATDPAGLNSRIVAQPLPSGEPRTVVEDGSDPRFLPSGQLIFTRGGVLFAGMLDERQMALRSEAVPVLEGIRRGEGGNVGAAQVAVSSSGSVAYLPGPASLSTAQRQLISIDMQGGRQPLNVPPLGYNSPRISPNGRWLAVDVEDRGAASIYIYPLSGDTQIRRLTLNGRNRFPVWSADSTQITFQSDVAGEAGIFWQRADGTGSAEPLTKSDPGTSHIPEAWSPDGKTLLYAVMRDGIYELYTYSSNDKRSAPFGVRSIYPPGSAVSPDGQWVAYFQRDHGGLPGSLFVQPLSGGAKHEVRNGSGIHPLWVPGGSPLRLIHRLPGSVYLLELTTSPTFGIAKTLELPWGVLFNPGPSSSRNMDFAGNDRIVTVTVPQMDQPASRGDEEMIQVVLNWLDELKQRVPMLR